MTIERTDRTTPFGFYFPSGWMSPNPVSTEVCERMHWLRYHWPLGEAPQGLHGALGFHDAFQYLTSPGITQREAVAQFKAIRLAVKEWLTAHPEEEA